MRYLPEHKQKTREKILHKAASLYRKHGINGLGLVKLMRSVNLTHGGFYAHFTSKTELFLSMLSSCFQSASNRVRPRNQEENLNCSYDSVLGNYLSISHCRNLQDGCTVSALSNDIARLPAEHRSLIKGDITQWLDSYIALCDGDKKEGLLTVSALLGAIQIARMFSDEKDAEVVIKTVKEALMDRA